MTILKLGNQEVRIDQGELVGYQVEGYEFIHQKGSPGWRNSDTEMFPTIGPTNEAGFKVNTPRGMAIQDQHGLLREMQYETHIASETKAVFIKKYLANTLVGNSKYPNKSSAENLSWPYDFTFKKIFFLNDQGLEIQFKINGEEGMPFMLGYHPAFKLTSESVEIIAGEKVVTIPEVMAVGSRALQIPSQSTITLRDVRELLIRTEGFNHFMLWTEVENMVCIEPITFYPYAVKQINLNDGFDFLERVKPKVFKVSFIPI